MKRKLLWVILVIVPLLYPTNRTQFASAQAKQAKWTVMVYIAANNNLEPNSIINLMEMAAVGSTPDVNIVVQITRPPDYKGFYGEWGGTRRYLVTKSDGGVSSGDFQISPTRFSNYVNTVADRAGLSKDQVSQITRAGSTQQEQAALQMSVPVIETQTPLTPLQVKDVQDLGTNINSADGATLADFGTWSVQHYPADHYGLIMWDHGGGWSMVAADDTLGPDGITMPGFQKALDTITQASKQKFDFIGFDACLMSQLGVEVIIKPYANYEIAAEELVPGFGWDYTPAMRALVANPALSVQDFAKAEIDGFNTLYSTTEKDAAESFDLGLTDLSKVDGVVKSLDNFDSAVKTAGGELKAIGTARGNVQRFGAVGESADVTDSISSVDLSDFMRLMTSLSSNDGVKQAAKGVIDAVSTMVVYHKASATLPNADGLSIFFPADSGTFANASGDRYRQEFGSLLPSWQGFLDAYYGVATTSTQSSKVQLHITNVSTTAQQPGSIQNTPVISYSLDGQNMVSLTANIIYQVDAKTNVVIDRFPVTSNVTTADGTEVNDFADGQSINDFYWNTKLPQISDGTNSLLVLMTSNPKDQQHGFIQGIYTNQQTGKQMNAWVLIDLDSYQSSGMWAAQTNQTIAEVFPKPNDTFEPVFVVLDQAGKEQLVASGTKLTFGKDPFQVKDTPGPDGKYSIVLDVTDAAGTDAIDVATVDVKNSGLDASLQDFKDLGFGISFLYPFSWTDVQTFTRQDGSDELYVTDETGNQTLSAVNYSDGASLADIEAKVKAEVNAIDGVKVGQTTAVTVAKSQGTSISYQYTDADGVQIAGTAVAVYIDATKQGYLLKIEVPIDQADAAQSLFNQVLQSSQFFAPVQ